jgi:hypothetical protein
MALWTLRARPRGVEEEHKIATKQREDVKKTRKVNRKLKEIKSITNEQIYT